MLYFPIYYRVSGFLRLILLPTEWYQRYTEDEDDHVSLSEIYYSEDFTYHFIDQFDVCYNTYSSNSYCARISFILPENHRLWKNAQRYYRRFENRLHDFLFGLHWKDASARESRIVSHFTCFTHLRQIYRCRY